ncbi:MAG: hypothetical protein H6636_09260 [Anaerolineales bacterium]|nr:hypothetical protein [Anaerolineales bacterium]
MNKKTLDIILFLILSAVIVVGCTPDNNNVEITTLTVSTPAVSIENGSESYPPPSNANGYPYPPTAATQTPPYEPYVFKTSDPGKITIHGVLIVFDLFMMAPAANDAIFLVPIPSGSTVSTIPLFTIGEVPQAEVDERTGEFYFTNIEPGRYAVVVITSADAQVPVRRADDASLAIFTVEESDRDTTVELEKITLP